MAVDFDLEPAIATGRTSAALPFAGPNGVVLHDRGSGTGTQQEGREVDAATNPERDGT
jgi:hypothetical protein